MSRGDTLLVVVEQGGKIGAFNQGREQADKTEVVVKGQQERSRVMDG